MRAVMPVVPDEVIAQRKRTGADQADEMWEGVLHVAPMPTTSHQEIEGAMEAYLRYFWAPEREARVYHQINVASVGGWPTDYRIPDLILLLPHRFAIDRDQYFEGAPSVVGEIHSPGDESHDKLPWYFALGVPEVWIVHRDTKVPEMHVRGRKKYRRVRPDAEGWVKGPVSEVELMRLPPDRLAVRVAGEAASRRELP